MTTLADVAHHAGVAPSTVSHVINGTRFVSENTRTLVLSAIEATGYIPNTLARSLARSGNATGTIGIAMSAASNPYFMNLIHAIEGELTALGQMVFLTDTREQAQRELDLVRSLHQRRVDGIILAPSGAAPGYALPYLMANKIPTVLVDRLIASDFDQIGVENVKAIRKIVKHLAGLGHRRIGMIGGQAGIATTVERTRAYQRALIELGLPSAPSLLVNSSGSVAEAGSAMLELLARNHAPSAVIAGNNQAMIGIMQALRRKEMSVPNDIAVVGFDDFEWADCFSPRLTVIAQPFEKIAHQAAQLLMTQIRGEPRTPKTIRLSPTLIVRESCGSPPKA